MRSTAAAIRSGGSFYRTYAFDEDAQMTGLYFRACEPVELKFGSVKPDYYNTNIVNAVVGRISNIVNDDNEALSEAAKEYIKKIFRLLLTDQKTRWMITRVWPAPNKICFALSHRTLQDRAISWEASEIEDAGQAILDELQRSQYIRLTIMGDNCSRSDQIVAPIELQCSIPGGPFSDHLHIRAAHDPRETDLKKRDWAYVSLVQANGYTERYSLCWQDESRKDIIALIDQP